jgi:hypothetical protein
MSITTKADLRTAITAAEMIAGRMGYPGHKLTMGERRVVARLMRDLAGIARRAFDPYARHDMSVEPRELREDDTAPMLFDEGAA